MIFQALGVFANQTKNMTNIVEILNVADSFTNNFLGFAIWLIIGMGSFFLMSQYNAKEALVASSFILMVTSIFLKYLNLLADQFMWVSGIFFVAAIVISVIGGRAESGA